MSDLQDKIDDENYENDDTLTSEEQSKIELLGKQISDLELVVLSGYSI